MSKTELKGGRMYSELTPADMIGTAMDTLARAKAYERNGLPQESCDMLREVRSLCSSAILRMGEERDRQRAESRRLKSLYES